MPNLHFACDFVFDVTQSLLIMQWTRIRQQRAQQRRLFAPRLANERDTAIVCAPLFFLPEKHGHAHFHGNQRNGLPEVAGISMTRVPAGFRKFAV